MVGRWCASGRLGRRGTSVLIGKSITFWPSFKEAANGEGPSCCDRTQRCCKARVDGIDTQARGAQALAERARIVPAAAGGLKNKEIASKLGICTHTVGTWRNRFAERGMDGLYDEPRA